MKNILPAILSLIMLQACTTASTKPEIGVFDNGRGYYKEAELASVSGFGAANTYVSITKVNGKRTESSFFGGSPDIIKIPPGRHHLEIFFYYSELSLRPATELFKDIFVDVEKGHKYTIYVYEERSGIIGSKFTGWIEDKATGKKVGIF